MKQSISLGRLMAASAIALVAVVSLPDTPVRAAEPTAPAIQAASNDWPQFRGNARDGISHEKGLLSQWPEDGPKLLWSVEGIGAGFSHVSVAKGLVYVTGLIGKEGSLRAFTLDGKQKWEVKYGPEYGEAHPGARTIPTVHEGLVYVMSGLGRLSCFDAADGKPAWSVNAFELADAKEIQWGYSESILVDGDRLFVTPIGKRAAMLALDRKTGKLIWSSKPVEGESSFCSPLMVEHAGKRMVVTMSNQAVIAFSPVDGAILWQHAYQNERQNHPDTPIYSDGRLYVTSGYGKGAVGLELSADGSGVKQVWEQKKQDPAHGQAVLVEGYVYASSHQSGSGKWSCVDFKTGKLMWQDASIGKGGSVIYAGGLLYCYSEEGVVGIVRPSPEKCEVISKFEVKQGNGSHWAHLVASNGRLFVRHGDVLMCYDIAAK